MASLYWDEEFENNPLLTEYLLHKRSLCTPQQWASLVTDLKSSTTLYVGELPFGITEHHIISLFSLCGPIERVVMGVNRNTKEFEGFCFVIFADHCSALCAKGLNGSGAFGGAITVELDPGFVDGRQFGRGSKGGQVSREFRTKFMHRKSKKSQTKKQKQQRPANKKALDADLDSYWNQTGSKEALDTDMHGYWEKSEKSTSMDVTGQPTSGDCVSAQSVPSVSVSKKKRRKNKQKKRKRALKRAQQRSQIDGIVVDPTSASGGKRRKIVPIPNTKYVLPEFEAEFIARKKQNDLEDDQIAELFSTASVDQSPSNVSEDLECLNMFGGMEE
eukprot:101095_1